MAKILCDERVVEYSTEFKVSVVNLTNKLAINTTKIAEVLNLHPVMIYRWRQEHREGKLVALPTRRISMTKERSVSKSTKTPLSETKKIKQLEKELAALKKENDFLKKWERYLKEQK